MPQLFAQRQSLHSLCYSRCMLSGSRGGPRSVNHLGWSYLSVSSVWDAVIRYVPLKMPRQLADSHAPLKQPATCSGQGCNGHCGVTSLHLSANFYIKVSTVFSILTSELSLSIELSPNVVGKHPLMFDVSWLRTPRGVIYCVHVCIKPSYWKRTFAITTTFHRGRLHACLLRLNPS